LENMLKPHKGLLFAATTMFIAMILLITVAALTLPLWLSVYLKYLHTHRHTDFLALMWILFFSAIQAVGILINATVILLNVNKGKTFVRENYTKIRVMGYLSFGITLLFVSCIFVYLTPYTIVFVAGSAMAGVLLFIVADLLKQGIAIQEENDLTV